MITGVECLFHNEEPETLYLFNSLLMQLLLFVFVGFYNIHGLQMSGQNNCILAPFINRFIRCLTWTSVMRNFAVRAAHLPGLDNKIADSLSRLKFQESRMFCPNAVRIYNLLGLI